MKKNITYLFGAGASSEALPLGANLGKSIKQCAELLERKYSYLLKDSTLIEDLYWLGGKAMQYQTVDAYARKLNMHLISPKEIFASNDAYIKVDMTKKYRRLKDALASFLILNQHKKQDKRYNTFLSHILQKVNPFAFSIRDNIKVASWNYDSQLEMAFADNYPNSSTKDVFGMIGSFPSPFLLGDNFYHNKDNKFVVSDFRTSVIHLNGLAGLIKNKENSYEVTELFNSRSLEELVSYITDIYNSAEPFLYFAWDEQNKAVELAVEELKATEILIIIGYSFPIFNKNVDRRIIKSMKGLEKIFIQDLYPDIIKNRVETLVNKVRMSYVLNDEVHSFLMPYEYF